jgi:protein TonB
LTKIDPPLPPVKAEPKKAEPPKSVEPLKAVPPVSTTRFVTPVVVTTAPTEEPPVIKEITGAVGPQTVKAPAGGDNVINKVDQGNGNGVASPNPGIVDASDRGLEVMPEPVGGAAAWSKFLQRNLRFPPVAQEQGVSGRVLLSFIIEKDGQLSNIKVEHGAGYGFDEEALRVLKLAKAWKPGIQNGQPVRVRYTIPMNFQLAEQ